MNSFVNTSSMFYEIKKKPISNKSKSKGLINVKKENVSTIKSGFNTTRNSTISTNSTKLNHDKILKSTQKSSFFKLSEKKINPIKSNNLHLNALNDFMLQNEFYFDLEKWKKSRGNPSIKEKHDFSYLDYSVFVPKEKLISLFTLKNQIDDSEYIEDDFLDKLSCFKSVFNLNNVSTKKAAEENVPK